MSTQTERCNFCVLQDVYAFAEGTGQGLELRRNGLAEENEQSAHTYYCAEGVDVMVGGARVMWLPREPKQCVCRK